MRGGSRVPRAHLFVSPRVCYSHTNRNRVWPRETIISSGDILTFSWGSLRTIEYMWWRERTCYRKVTIASCYKVVRASLINLSYIIPSRIFKYDYTIQNVKITIWLGKERERKNAVHGNENSIHIDRIWTCTKVILRFFFFVKIYMYTPQYKTSKI
jgi:hypothetical protein